MSPEECQISIFLYDIRSTCESDDVKSDSSYTLFRLLSLGADLERIRKYMIREDRLRTAAAELILRSMILANKPAKIVRTNPHTHQQTKPFIDSVGLQPQFNVSHDAEHVAVAVTVPHISVGIDLMKVALPPNRTQHDFFENMHTVFTSSEWRYIKGDTTKSLRRFFHLWTAKEAYLKCIGTGLAIDPSEIEILIHDAESDKPYFEAHVSQHPIDHFRITIFEDTLPDNVIALCVSSLHNCDSSWVSLLAARDLFPPLKLEDISYNFIHLDSL